MVSCRRALWGYIVSFCSTSPKGRGRGYQILRSGERSHTGTLEMWSHDADVVLEKGKSEVQIE